MKNTIIAKIVAGKNSINRLKKKAKTKITINIIIRAKHSVAPRPIIKLIDVIRKKK